MQISFKAFFSLLVLALFVVACGPAGEKAETGDAVDTNTEGSGTEMVYNINPAATTITWEGAKLIGGGHTGTLKVIDGQILVKDNNIVGGKFNIDMASLANADLEAGKGKEKLEGHLKSADFFDVEAHPTAMFAIASAQAVTGNASATHMLTGNLTMKGATKSVTIPVSVTMSGNELTAVTPPFTINRMDWDVKYGSGSMEGIAQDKIINDEVGLKIELKASAGTASN